jgi:hypothetical protein
MPKHVRRNLCIDCVYFLVQGKLVRQAESSNDVQCVVPVSLGRCDQCSWKLLQELRCVGPGNVVGIATAYGLDGPGIESRWGRDFPHLSRPALRPTNLL